MKKSTPHRFSRELVERVLAARGIASTAASRTSVQRELRATRSAYHQILIDKRLPFFGTKQQATILTIAEAEAFIGAAAAQAAPHTNPTLK